MYGDDGYRHPSSPPSSPRSCNDSSPPSSPNPSYSASLADDSITADDPYAASAKTTRTPRQYEKKTPRAHHTPPKEQQHWQETPVPLKRQRLAYHTQPVEHDSDIDKWDEAIDNAIDESQGSIHLEAENLNYIPAKISTLRQFTALPKHSERGLATLLSSKRTLLRSETEGSPRARNTLFTKTRSTGGTGGVGVPREELQLFLQVNRISVLPRELFLLDKLTFLSLRENNLKHIPPEIRSLTSLRELNIARNQITFLPSEMLSMHHLTKLHLHPNPFITLTPTSQRTSHPHFGCGQIDLAEICLRKLVSPPGEYEGNVPDPKNTFVMNHPDSLDQLEYLPEHLKRLLYSCLALPPPPTPLSSSAEEPTSISICPSNSHDTSQVFVRPAEIRYTWEKKIGGAETGGGVPVRWRGCLKGCLSFLGGDEDDDSDSGDNDADASHAENPEDDGITEESPGEDNEENEEAAEEEEANDDELQQDEVHFESDSDISMTPYRSSSSSDDELMFLPSERGDLRRAFEGYGVDDDDEDEL